MRSRRKCQENVIQISLHNNSVFVLGECHSRGLKYTFEEVESSLRTRTIGRWFPFIVSLVGLTGPSRSHNIESRPRWNIAGWDVGGHLLWEFI